MIITILSMMALITAVLHIRADYFGPRWQTYIFKPATTTLILLIALFSSGDVGPFYGYAIVAGLLFSLAGDIFLMLPADKFILGLASFLIAHLFYIVAFTSLTGFGVSAAALWPYLLYGGLFAWLLWPYLGRMKGPVLLYMLVILVMAWQALEQWLALGQTGALLIAVGAALFVISDSALAWNRFRRPFVTAQLLVLSSYYLAQWLIALSVGFL